MGFHVADELAKAIAQEEAHGQPRRIGGDAQDVEGHVGVDACPVPFHVRPFCQGIHQPLQILFLVFVILIPKTELFQRIRIGLLPTLRPEQQGDVTDPGVLGGDEVVQGSAVGEGGVLAGGGVEALLPVVGAEGRSVEGDQGGTAGLGARDAFDAGMETCYWSYLTGNQARKHFTRLVVIVVILLPHLTNSRNFVQKLSSIAKDEVRTA